MKKARVERKKVRKAAKPRRVAGVRVETADYSAIPPTDPDVANLVIRFFGNQHFQHKR